MHLIEIYQVHLEDGVPFPDWTFRDYDSAMESGFDVSEYDKVYEYEDYSNDLERVFEKFNIAFPDDYRGRSLSVSDIVVMDGIGFYVDSIGFRELLPEDTPEG